MGTTAAAERRFAHASEAEMARILDFYAVRWEYEPHVFPILWNLDGDVIESFAPDFYLPDLDLYLEMTTLKQRLVRKKNRKLRRLRELYPDLRVKLFYARDFRALMLKYGKLALLGELSGTPGQVPPPAVAVAADTASSEPQAPGLLAAELEVPEPAIAAPTEPSPADAGIAAVTAAVLAADPQAVAVAVTRARSARSRTARRRRAAAARRAAAPAVPAAHLDDGDAA
jgi:hypoxanthine phosphoribosyltransferase